MRPALFLYKGIVKADADHNLCLQHFRSISESNSQKEKFNMTARLVDANNSRLTDAMFAAAYRMTIPTLADAKHVTVRACSARLSELSANATDISDVVELGTAKDGKVRAVAAPVNVHVDDGAEVIADDTFTKTVVSFEVNGHSEVQIVNLALSVSEQKAIQDAADAAAKVQADADKVALDAKLAAAKKEGAEEAMLAKAKAEGAASVGEPATDKVQ